MGRKPWRRLVAASAVALVASGTLAAAIPTPAGAATATSIDVCCAWNTRIEDGLTFSISAPDTTVAGWIENGVRAWAAQVPGLVLTRVSSGAEVAIKFKKGGGQVQGSTKRSFVGGFINFVSISVSGRAFGVPNGESDVTTIAAHEFGHALGANHANGDGMLMSPTLTGGAKTIQACDAKAVDTAQDWFVTGATAPYPPPATSVAC